MSSSTTHHEGLREGKVSAMAGALDEADLLMGSTPDSGAGKSHARDVIEGLRRRGFAVIQQRPYMPTPPDPDTANPDDDGEPEPEPIEEAGS